MKVAGPVRQETSEMTGMSALRGAKQFLKKWCAPKLHADVIFYAASSIDETWVRATILECRRRGHSCLLVIGGDWHEDQRRNLERAGVSIICNANSDVLLRLCAPLVVTASSGVPRSIFSRDIGTLVHMPHSIVSLHMIYPEDGFDGFDVLFAAGPHHIREFKSLSALRGLGHRTAVPVGYGRFDLLKAQVAPASADGVRQHILIAPSWGHHGLLPSIGRDMISALLARKMRVTLRPHPLHVLNNDPVLLELRGLFTSNENFSEESPRSLSHSMNTADVLITDFSGTAFEFAWLRRRPTLFVDVPKKIMNPSWQEAGLVPVEIGLREDIGVLARPDVDLISEAAAQLCGSDDWETRINTAIPKFLFEELPCCQAAANEIDGLLEKSIIGARR